MSICCSWGNVFRQNVYGNQQIQKAFNCPLRVAQPDNKPDSVTFLPYVRSIFNCISMVLSQHMKSVGLPPRKILSYLQSVNSDLGLRTQELYNIPYE
jgi:hypothetical protein